MTAPRPPARRAELVPLAGLRPHPRNYRRHPPAQLDHLEASLREYGVLPTTVIARDGTILGGHGVWETAERLGLDAIPATRLDLDPDEPAALKLMAALNFLDRLALDDEAALAAILAEVAEADAAALLGSGWTPGDLAALVLVAGDGTADDPEQHWRGMPGFGTGDELPHVTVNFATEDDLARFCELTGLPNPPGNRCWWPPRVRDDSRSLGYADAGP
jgi:hypothetical protein